MGGAQGREREREGERGAVEGEMGKTRMEKRSTRKGERKNRGLAGGRDANPLRSLESPVSFVVRASRAKAFTWTCKKRERNLGDVKAALLTAARRKD